MLQNSETRGQFLRHRRPLVRAPKSTGLWCLRLLWGLLHGATILGCSGPDTYRKEKGHLKGRSDCHCHSCLKLPVHLWLWYSRLSYIYKHIKNETEEMHCGKTKTFSRFTAPYWVWQSKLKFKADIMHQVKHYGLWSSTTWTIDSPEGFRSVEQVH